MPTQLNSAQVTIARNPGSAIREVTGKLMKGTISRTLAKKTKKNSVTRYGRNRSPSLPMTSRMICRRTKSMPYSMTFCSPRGTIRSEEHTSELQSHHDLVCRLLLEKKKATPSITQKIASLIIGMSTRFDTKPGFFFNDTATTEIYTLSLHDALPI